MTIAVDMGRKEIKTNKLLLSPVFTCIRQTIKLSLSHALLYSFIVFKYVILILRKDKYILGRNDLYFWGSGEKLRRVQ